MIYEVDDMIDDSSGRGKDTKLSGIFLVISLWGYLGGKNDPNGFGYLQTT